MLQFVNTTEEKEFKTNNFQLNKTKQNTAFKVKHDQFFK